MTACLRDIIENGGITNRSSSEVSSVETGIPSTQDEESNRDVDMQNSDASSTSNQDEIVLTEDVEANIPSTENELVDEHAKSKEEDESHLPRASRMQTAITLINGILGMSPLALPYAMQQSGWALVAIILVAAVGLGSTLWLSGYILELIDVRASELGIPRLSRSWDTVGQIAFGYWGGMIFAGFMLLDSLSCVVAVIILAGQSLHLIVTAVSTTWLIIVFGLLCLCLLYFPERYLAKMAIVGVIAFVLYLVSLVITSLELGFMGEMAKDQIIIDISGLVSGMGVVIWLFYLHAQAPMIYQMMEDRSQWRFSVIWAMCISVSVVIFIAVLGYLFFGEAAQVSLTDNLGRDLSLNYLPGFWNPLMAIACSGFVAVKLLFTVPLLAAPIVTFAETQMGMKAMSGKFLFRTCFMGAVIFIAALLQNDFATVMEYCGPCVQATVCVTLPCVAYLKLKTADIGPLQKTLLWTCISAAVFYAIFGTAHEILG